MEFFRVVNIDEDRSFLETMSFSVKYCRYCNLMLPLLSVITYALLMIFVVLNPKSGLPIYISLIVGIGFGFSVIYSIWSAATNGNFVVAANENGFCYQSKKKKNIYIFIAWQWVREILTYEADGKELHFRTSIDENKDLPKPSNGSIYKEHGGKCFMFAPGLTPKSSKMLKELQRLKNQSFKK